jgi:DNA-binding MarR family transcriptional regulator
LTERGLGRLLREAHRSLSKAMQDQLAPYEITMSQWLHLRELWEEDGINQVEIASRLGIEKASSTAVLDALERRGWITRTRNSANRRRVDIFLTQDGIALQARLVPLAKAVNRIAHRGLSTAEILALERTMQVISGNLERYHREEPGWTVDRVEE